MDWALARERLGEGLIAARDGVAARWRLALRDGGAEPWALDSCAAELVLQAGAALADGAPAATPWRRCQGLLRIDAGDRGRALAAELSLLWSCMAGRLARLALCADEELRAREELGQQLEAALRGAAADLRAALLDEAAEDGAPRFGGVTAVCRTTPGTPEPAEERAA